MCDQVILVDLENVQDLDLGKVPISTLRGLVLAQEVKSCSLCLLLVGLLAGCSLMKPPPARDYAAIEQAQLLKSEAEARLDPATTSLYECMFRYADNHALAAATPSEIAEAATIACDDKRDELTKAIQVHGYAQARVALAERGTRMPAADDLTRLANRLAQETIEDGRKRALDIIVRARSPSP